MLFYWVVNVLVSFVVSLLRFIPGLHTLKVIMMFAMLSPKINMKSKYYEVMFGEAKQFEKIVEMAKVKGREIIQKVKKIQ